MISQFDIFYEVVNPGTQKTELVTEDRFIAEVQYEKGYTVYEVHRTITRQSTFTQTRTNAILQWHDEDSENINHESEEAQQ
jgi:hypothetical protein